VTLKGFSVVMFEVGSFTNITGIERRGGRDETIGID
jgi:hypothetical protein